MEQLRLFRMTETDLKAILEQTAQRPVALTFTKNTRRVLSVKRSGDVLKLRLHRVFLEAPLEVLSEVSGFIRGQRKAGLIRSFLKEKKDEIGDKIPPRAVTLGRHYDLKDIYEEVNTAYFSGDIDACVSWGVNRGPRYVRKRTLGSYNYATKAIKINPVLDSSAVPRYYLSFILYHEMLHASIGPGNGSIRKRHHTKEFRQKERLFKDYEKALAWERENRL